VVDDLDEVVHQFLHHETQLVLAKPRDDLLDQVRALRVEDQLHHVVADSLLDQFLLLA
jgi:hypothetical protein